MNIIAAPYVFTVLIVCSSIVRNHVAADPQPAALLSLEPA